MIPKVVKNKKYNINEVIVRLCWIRLIMVNNIKPNAQINIKMVLFLTINFGSILELKRFMS